MAASYGNPLTITDFVDVQSCPTLCDLMDCSPPGSSILGILQTRTLEWVAISFSRGFSQPGDQSRVSCLTIGFSTTEPPGKPLAGLLASHKSFRYHGKNEMGKESGEGSQVLCSGRDSPRSGTNSTMLLRFPGVACQGRQLSSF